MSIYLQLCEYSFCSSLSRAALSAASGAPARASPAGTPAAAQAAASPARRKTCSGPGAGGGASRLGVRLSGWNVSMVCLFYLLFIDFLKLL